MSISVISCALGILFCLSIACLHATGFSQFTGAVQASDVSNFIKDMFRVLYVVPTLFLLVLACFGGLALTTPKLRKPVCLILAPATASCGALALMLGEWIPLVVMGVGAALFLLAALKAPST